MLSTDKLYAPFISGPILSLDLPTVNILVEILLVDLFIPRMFKFQLGFGLPHFVQNTLALTLLLFFFLLAVVSPLVRSLFAFHFNGKAGSPTCPAFLPWISQSPSPNSAAYLPSLSLDPSFDHVVVTATQIAVYSRICHHLLPVCEKQVK